jgi:hypothetical protein
MGCLFPTEQPKKVKPETPNSTELLENAPDKVVHTKEREDKAYRLASQVPEQAERHNPYWCDAHGFCYSQRLEDHKPDCRLEG